MGLCNDVTRQGGCEMPASTDFAKLKEQVEEADQRIRASAAQGADELKAMVDEARNNADARAAELGTKAREAGERRRLTGTRSRATGIGTSSRFASASMPRRQSTTPMSQSAMPSGPRPTHTTLSSSRRPQSRRPSTRCSTLSWPGKTRTSWRPPPSAVATASCPSRPSTGHTTPEPPLRAGRRLGLRLVSPGR